MIRLVMLLAALAVGFGVGVYWGVHHPVEAKKLATEEERRFIEAQKKLLERVKTKLDQMASGNAAGTTGAVAPGGRSGFLSAAQSGGGKADPEVAALRDESQRQLEEAQKMLTQMEAQ